MAKIRAKGEALSVEILAATRSWWSLMEPAKVHPFHAFMTRAGVEAPHSIVWKFRADLTPTEAQAITSRHAAMGASGDVFCLVKNFIEDTSLLQEPVLALPAARAARVPQQIPHRPAPLLRQSDKRAGELEKLANMCLLECGMHSAAANLRTLAVRTEARQQDLREITWLQEVGEPPRSLVATHNPQYPNLPETAWQLKVRFGRL